MKLNNNFYWTKIECSEVPWIFLPIALNLSKSENVDYVGNKKSLYEIFEKQKILILTSNVKKIATNNCLNLMIDSFEGKEGDIVDQIIKLNNIQTEVKIERIQSMYGSLDEYFLDLKNKILKHQASVVIVESQVKILAEFSGIEHKASKDEVKDFYHNFKDLIEMHGLNKIISRNRIFDILNVDDLKAFFWNNVKDVFEVYIKDIRRFKDKISCTLVSNFNSSKTRKEPQIQKVSIFHDGQIKSRS